MLQPIWLVDELGAMPYADKIMYGENKRFVITERMTRKDMIKRKALMEISLPKFLKERISVKTDKIQRRKRAGLPFDVYDNLNVEINFEE
jgi:hypothetical protein